ncbi:MAG TPA: amino acid transporter [Alphaproteobacteria bacterium]|nr:amino acid transporter [Alphaproteobacteria bacterium]
MTLHSIRNFFFGKPLDPLDTKTRSHIALIAFFAWIGLGADGISSSCYGPEETFLALGTHTPLAIILALATGITVFLIAFSYNQIIERFPTGGGGYKVASALLGPKAGLVAGSALVIDYVLTVSISVAAAVDALYSLTPDKYEINRIISIMLLIGLLTYMNLRGLKESIKILMPIFLGFIITHIVLISYGIFGHSYGLGDIVNNAVEDTKMTAEQIGVFAGAVILLKAFSLGGGTYTGLEAVSNSMNTLAEPKVKTAKLTMMALASSLALMAMGIITIYLLWDVQKVEGQTLNATVFLKITSHWELFGYNISEAFVFMVMLFSAGLLFVAANAGFISGPNVLAAMASDRWLPAQFSSLSSRLVTRNGIMLIALGAAISVILTGGKVHTLVVLYSINVFITFCLSLSGITLENIRERNKRKNGYRKIIVPFMALIVCTIILIATTTLKFFDGGWMTIGITGMLIATCLYIKNYYRRTNMMIARHERDLEMQFNESLNVMEICPQLKPDEKTAVIVVNESSASGLHALKWINDTFPNQFYNFVFVAVGEIDTHDFNHDEEMKKLRHDTRLTLKKYIDITRKSGFPAEYEINFSTDLLGKMTEMAEGIVERYPNSVFFSNKIINEKDNPILQVLYNQIAYILQRRLHNRGINMIVIPFKV